MSQIAIRFEETLNARPKLPTRLILNNWYNEPESISGVCVVFLPLKGNVTRQSAKNDNPCILANYPGEAVHKHLSISFAASGSMEEQSVLRGLRGASISVVRCQV